MRNAFVSLVPLGFASALVVVSTVAQAQNVAEQLYRDGQKLIADGHTREACLKFAESHRAEPALGTLIALAACHEREEKLASAWSEFSEAAELAEAQKDARRAQFAKTRAAALEKRVYRVRLELTSPPPRVSLKLGDKEYGEGAFGSLIPLDPGEWTVQVSAPGHATWLRIITVAANGGEETIVVDLTPETATRIEPDVTRPAPPAEPQSTDDSGRRVLGYVVGGAGLALGITAAALQMSAAAASSDAVDEAHAANAANDRARYDAAAAGRDDAVGLQGVALVAGGVGVVAIVVGAYFVLTSSGSSMRAAPAASARGFGLGGTF